SAHFGQITTATATVGGTAFTAPFWFAQEQPAYIALRTPGTIYTYLQPGDVIGQLVAYSDSGFPPGLGSYQLTASDGTVALTSTGQIVVAPGQSLTAGSKSMTVRVTALTGMVTTKVIAYTVVAGTLLLPSSMTMTVNSALENWSYGQSVGTPTV